MEDIKQRNSVQHRFDQERRVFVFNALKDSHGPGIARQKIVLELDAYLAEHGDGLGEVSFVKEQLLKHLDKQAGRAPIVRFVTRWAVPTGGALVTIAYIYLQVVK